MTIKRIYRDAPNRDVTIDVSDTITPNRGQGRRIAVPISAPTANVFSENPTVPTFLTLDLPLELYAISRQEQEVVKTEEWGDYKVEYVETWKVTVKWLGIKHDAGALLS